MKDLTVQSLTGIERKKQGSEGADALGYAYVDGFSKCLSTKLEIDEDAIKDIITKKHIMVHGYCDTDKFIIVPVNKVIQAIALALSEGKIIKG